MGEDFLLVSLVFAMINLLFYVLSSGEKCSLRWWLQC